MKDTEELNDLFDKKFWAAWPKGEKRAKKTCIDSWVKIFKKDPGIPYDEWAQFADVIVAGLERQVEYRKRVVKMFPNPQDRKNAGVFLPSMPMPSTWLNQGRWADEVPDLPNDGSQPVDKTKCRDCSSPATNFVKGVGLCAWHYTKKFDRPWLRVLANQLKKIGLDRKPGETKEAWCDRCRDYAITEKGWKSS